MGEIHILTKEQQLILDEIKQSNDLSQFYFTGGTALSALYLQHRYSEDLDLFSENKFDNQTILGLVEGWSKKYHFTFQSEFHEVVYIFQIQFPNAPLLKVDFGFYPYKRIGESKLLRGVKTDSLNDIAVNKLFTITQRTTIKDFVDLYFLLPKFGIWDLMYGVESKFRTKLEPFIVSSDFLKVEEFDIMPRMIKPLTPRDLKIFYREQAKNLGRQSVE